MPYRRRALQTGRRLCYDIGKHLVRLALVAEGWTASVDGLSLEGRFSNEAQAWQEGVRVALQLEGPPSAPPPPAPARPTAPSSPSSPSSPSTPGAPGGQEQDTPDDDRPESEALRTGDD
jgi:hypothetical protein